MSVKTYVLDTSTLVYNPDALSSFKDNNLVIHTATILELDGLKKRQDETGVSARQAIQILDKLTEKYAGNMDSGIPLPPPASGSLRILNGQDKNTRPDSQIIALALSLKDREDVVLVSQDANMRVRARAKDLRAEPYKTDRVQLEELYTGIYTVEVETLPRFNSDRQAEVPRKVLSLNPHPNACLVLRQPEESWCRYAIFKNNPGEKPYIRKVNWPPRPEEGKDGQTRPRNLEQKFAYELCLDPEIPFVTEIGVAGTGKDLIALLAAMNTLEKSHQRIVIANPTFPMGGRELGYLPGSLGEKLAPWNRPSVDIVNLIGKKIEPGTKEKDVGRMTFADELVEKGCLIVASLSHIRGATFHNSFVIVTEAQNLTPHEIKTIATRVGQGTKLVVNGDLYQIDNRYLDPSSSGLTHLVTKFKSSHLTAHIRLVRSERSPAAEFAASVL